MLFLWLTALICISIIPRVIRINRMFWMGVAREFRVVELERLSVDGRMGVVPILLS